MHIRAHKYTHTTHIATHTRPHIHIHNTNTYMCHSCLATSVEVFSAWLQLSPHHPIFLCSLHWWFPMSFQSTYDETYLISGDNAGVLNIYCHVRATWSVQITKTLSDVMLQKPIEAFAILTSSSASRLFSVTIIDPRYKNWSTHSIKPSPTARCWWSSWDTQNHDHKLNLKKVHHQTEETYHHHMP